MKKPIFFILAFLIISNWLSAQNIPVNYKVAYKVQKTEPTDALSLHFHCSYNFNNAVRYETISYDSYGTSTVIYQRANPLIEFGGSLSYYFKKADGKYGILVGYDNGVNQWWTHPYDGQYVIYKSMYWNLRFGACITKYFSVGMTYGNYLYNYESYKNDYGLFMNGNLPFTDMFGIFADAKWTYFQGFSVGGGFFIRIPIK